MKDAERAPRATDGHVHLVEAVYFELAQGALILALVSGGHCWKFGLTLPLIFLMGERLRKYVARPCKVLRGAFRRED